MAPVSDRSARGLANKAQLGAFEGKQREHVEFQPLGVRAQRRQKASARVHNGLKPMRFVSLHHHSTFSFLDGFQLPEAHVRRATEIQMGALAMTEHGNIFSHVKLEKAAMEAGIKPIFGCEFYCGYTDEERRAQKKNHLTVIAKNAEGYANLLMLTSRSWREGFYFEPTVDWRWLEQHQKGLVILSGCQGSALFTALVGGKHVAKEDASYRRGLRVAKWMGDRFDDFYIEVQAFPELESTRLANPLLARIARDIGRPLVATMDCHYTAPEEAEIQKILHNVRPGEQRTLEELEQDWGYTVPLAPPPTDRAIYRRLRNTGLSREQAIEAIVSTEEIAQEIDVTLPKLPRTEFPLPDGYDNVTDLWRDKLREGWAYRGCHSLEPEERDRYKAQLAKEMEVIEAKGYENYFMIVADSVVFAKEQQIPVGPARGSAAASLACWLLRITEVNPMEFDNLVFERFIDWSREDMPDIDLDFATYGRPIVREYLVEKYGDDCVSNIGTFTTYKSAMALKDVARVHRVPYDAVDAIKSVLIERSGGDLRASATIEDTVDQFDGAYEAMKENPALVYSMDLEGNVKAHSVHAAGLVVSSEPITNVTSLLEKEVPKGSGNVIQVIAMDKYDCERQGLEKLDYLALSTMDVIAEALRMLDMTLEELYDLPVNDPEVIQGFHDNDVAGIFQFQERATRIVCGAVKPDNFDEIVSVNALSRPGPLHNGAVQGYVGAKFGTAEPERIHPALDLLTEDTQYQIIFQEQILRIVAEIGGFDWTSSAYIRRIISKKLGEQEFNRQWSAFRDGALAVHTRMDVPPMDEETAKRIWGMCITAGAYAFNAAHSTAYSKIAYWTMWLKRHHTPVFYAASLAKTEGDSERTLLRDAVKHGIEVRPPSIVSGATWDVGMEDEIYAGWKQIPGIADRMAERIEDHGPYKELADLERVPGIGPKKLETITAFAEASDPFGIYRLEENIESVRADVAKGIDSAQGKLPEPSHTANEIFDERGGARITMLGQPVHLNLRDIFEANRAKTGEALDPATVKNPELSQWVVMTVRDADDLASFVISRKRYPKFKEMIWKVQLESDQLVLITGKKGKMKGTLGDRSGIVFVDRMWVLEP